MESSIIATITLNVLDDGTLNAECQMQSQTISAEKIQELAMLLSIIIGKENPSEKKTTGKRGRKPKLVSEEETESDKEQKPVTNSQKSDKDLFGSEPGKGA